VAAAFNLSTFDVNADHFGLTEEAANIYRRQVAREACEASLLIFSRYFFPTREGLRFRVNWHHLEICRALEKVHRGEIRNLVINVPPGSSKTELAVINFMAWSIAKNPRCRFLHLSYADTLVEENSSKTKDLIESEEFQALWPLQTRRDSKAKKRWNIELDGKRAGGCYAVALGGTITGFRAGHMADGFQGAILIDDPLKPEDAFSEAKLKAANRKLADTVRSRKANPETPVIIIMQRLHIEDATAFALDGKIGGLEFEQIKIPALDEDGESYWPYKEPAHELEAWKEANPYTFAGQMQQEPTVLGGAIFKGDWWRYWGTDEHPLPRLSLVWIFGDTAMKAEERHDYSVFQAWGLGVDGNAYLLDQVRGKWEAPNLRTQAVAFWGKWKARPLGEASPYPSKLAIEDKASGTGLIQSLRRESGIPVEAIPRGAERNKVVRANSVAPSIAAGRVFLPDPHAQPNGWLTDYLAEFAAFTPEMTHAHDDQVDPTMDAIEHMILGNANIYAGAL
jgi:predicted phage terminase large subunit-like protein